MEEEETERREYMAEMRQDVKAILAGQSATNQWITDHSKHHEKLDESVEKQKGLVWKLTGVGIGLSMAGHKALDKILEILGGNK